MYSRSLLISPPFSSAWLRLRLITCSWDGTWRCWWPGGPWSLHDLLSKSWMSARKLSWLKDGPRGVQDINDITAFDWDTVKHSPISLQHIENTVLWWISATTSWVLDDGYRSYRLCFLWCTYAPAILDRGKKIVQNHLWQDLKMKALENVMLLDWSG